MEKLILILHAIGTAYQKNSQPVIQTKIKHLFEFKQMFNFVLTRTSCSLCTLVLLRVGSKKATYHSNCYYPICRKGL